MRTDEKTLATIRTLLAIADGGSPYAPEREAARERAERLMLRHSIDAATIAMTDEEARKPTRKDIDIHGSYRLDKMILQAAVYQGFGCSVIRHSTRKTKEDRVRVYGFAHDIEMASTLADSLQVQMITGMAAHGGTVGNRKAFAAGFAYEVKQRLTIFYATALQEAETEGTGSALVLADRTALVEAAVRDDNPKLRRHPARRLASDGWDAGQTAGAKADIALGGRKVGTTRPAITS